MGELVNLLNTAGGAFVAFAGHMLIQSSVLIVILAALDLVLRKRVKAVVRYWIWLLILAKLLLPSTRAASLPSMGLMPRRSVSRFLVRRARSASWSMMSCTGPMVTTPPTRKFAACWMAQ